MPLDPSTASRLKEALATVVVIPVTPMRPDGSPEWGTYADLIRRVVDAGITVITPNGNTGEFYALTEAEARQATEAAVKAAHGEVALGARAHVLVGVGHDTASAAGDLTGAMDMWEAIRPFEDLRAAGGAADNVSVVKEALAQLGLCGRDVRPPSRALPDTERAAVGAILRSWDPFAASETGGTAGRGIDAGNDAGRARR